MNLLPLKRLYWKATHLAPNEIERLFDRYGGIPRHTPATIEFRGMKVQTPDALSVLFHLCDFFVDRSCGTLDPASSLIIDCGSNVGASVLFFRQQCPRAKIIAFEPDREIFSYLQRNTRDARDMELHNSAVWTADGTVRFTPDNADGGFIGTEGIAVPSVRLKTVLEKYDRIDFLKMDIEGAEVAVLEDCADALARVAAVYVEYHDQHQRGRQRLDLLLSILSNAGFRYNMKTAEFGEPLQVNIRAQRAR